MRLSRLFVVAVLLLTGLAPEAALAQEPFDVRVVTRQDGQVVVFHTATVRLGHGVVLSRRDAGASDFVRLTEQPVRPARNEAEAAAAFGEFLPQVLEQENASSAFVALAQLLSDPAEATIVSALVPGVARALARSVVDEDAPIGQQVTYRVELVDERGELVGSAAEATATLRPTAPPPPNGLAASHEGLRVTLRWDAIQANSSNTVGFHVYTGGERLTERPMLNNQAADTLSFAFVVPVPGPQRITVRSLDLTGQEGPDSDVLAYEVTDNVPPEFVRSVYAFVDRAGLVEVTWPLSPDADLAGYHVYRSLSTAEDAVQTLLTQRPLPPTQTIFRDSVATGSGARSYFYTVTALDLSGNESPPSAVAMAQVADRTPPPSPSGLTADFANGAVTLNWTAPVASDLETFIVERRRLTAGATPSKAQLNRDTLLTSSLVDRGEADLGFQEGEAYRYYVTAQDSARNFSVPDSTDLEIPNVTPPEPPGSFVASNDRGFRVRLSWTPSPSPDVVGYRITRGDSTLGDVATTTYRDDDVEPGARYVYSVVAVDSGENVSVPVMGDVVFRDQARPPPVRNVRAVPAEGGVLVTWEPSPATDVSTYRVEYAAIRTGVYTPLTVTEATTWTHTGSEAGWYRVIALDASGHESAASESAQALTSDL